MTYTVGDMLDLRGVGHGTDHYASFSQHEHVEWLMTACRPGASCTREAVHYDSLMLDRYMCHNPIILGHCRNISYSLGNLCTLRCS